MVESLVIHLIASVIFAVAEETVFAAVTPRFGHPWFKPNFIATFRDVLPIDFHLNLIMYWLIVSGQHVASYYRRYRPREHETARLELRASELQNQLGQARATSRNCFPFRVMLVRAVKPMRLRLVRRSETWTTDGTGIRALSR